MSIDYQSDTLKEIIKDKSKTSNLYNTQRLLEAAPSKELVLDHLVLKIKDSIT